MTRTRVSALVLLLLLAGCAKKHDGGGDVATAQTGKATPSASTGASTGAGVDPDAPLKFAQCMRAHGMTWFPDPTINGRQTINTPKGLDPAKFEAAQEACKQFAPNGGIPPKVDAQSLEMVREMAKCMRAHGVPNFPDPKPDGTLQIDPGKLGTGPGKPAFDKADQACAQYRPSGAGHGPGTTTGGGSDGGLTVQGGGA